MGPLLSAPAGASKRETPTSNLKESTAGCGGKKKKNIVNYVETFFWGGGGGEEGNVKKYNFDYVENTLDYVEISTVNKLLRKPFKCTKQR